MKPIPTGARGSYLLRVEFRHLANTFKHALTLDVAFGTLLQDRRRALDARLVTAIEGLSGERTTDQVERLARHAFRGGAWNKAVTYCREAGARAFARSAHRTDARYFEQALQAFENDLPNARRVTEADLRRLGVTDRVLDALCYSVRAQL